jgi:hypothetical protein
VVTRIAYLKARPAPAVVDKIHELVDLAIAPIAV